MKIGTWEQFALSPTSRMYPFQGLGRAATPVKSENSRPMTPIVRIVLFQRFLAQLSLSLVSLLWSEMLDRILMWLEKSERDQLRDGSLELPGKPSSPKQ